MSHEDKSLDEEIGRKISQRFNMQYVVHFENLDIHSDTTFFANSLAEAKCDLLGFSRAFPNSFGYIAKVMKIIRPKRSVEK